MNRSAELKEIMLRFYASGTKMDFWTRQEGALLIGSDPGEWLAGFEDIHEFFGVDIQETEEGIKMQAGDLHTFAEGSVGWLADNPKFILPNGREIPCRVTTLFHKEDGEWRIVQHHVSIAIPNAELLAKYGM